MPKEKTATSTVPGDSHARNQTSRKTIRMTDAQAEQIERGAELDDRPVSSYIVHAAVRRSYRLQAAERKRVKAEG